MALPVSFLVAIALGYIRTPAGAAILGLVFVTIGFYAWRIEDERPQLANWLWASVICLVALISLTGRFDPGPLGLVAMETAVSGFLWRVSRVFRQRQRDRRMAAMRPEGADAWISAGRATSDHSPLVALPGEPSSPASRKE
jgi:hypothetical protein